MATYETEDLVWVGIHWENDPGLVGDLFRFFEEADIKVLRIGESGPSYFCKAYFPDDARKLIAWLEARGVREKKE